MTISPDAKGQMFGPLKRLFDYLPNLPTPVVVISWFPDYKFVIPIYNRTEKWVLVDFLEPHPPNHEYDMFWAWVEEHPPILTFKRELALKDAVDPAIKPIEFPATSTPPEPQKREEWHRRPIETLFFWGYSHPSRPLLHGDIWRGMADDGINVVGDWRQIQGATKERLWVSIYTPHWDRKPMAEIYPIMAQSKITIVMPGNGKKCFRHGETIDSLMALRNDDMAWSYPWHELNSILLNPNVEYQDLQRAIGEKDLYELYVACCENMKNYEPRTYALNYIQKEIERCL